MAKKDIDWSNLGFGYVKTDKRFVANYKDGAWDNGVITDDDKVVISECAGVLQYSQSCFEGMKAYTTENGHTVIFRPDMNASRMADSCMERRRRGFQRPGGPYRRLPRRPWRYGACWRHRPLVSSTT